jgi:large subunit ribosomal protein L25
MEKVYLDTQIREEIGKSGVNRIRKEGLVPAVVYHRGEAAIPVKVKGHDLLQVLHTGAGENVIIELRIAGTDKKDNKTVLIKEIQHNPVRGDILHVDFQEISLTEEIEVTVPIAFKGESVGVKEGGMLEHHLWELEIQCLPTAIPEKFNVDISALAIGDAVHVRNIVVPAGIKIVSDPEEMVVSCVPPRVEAVEEAVEVTEEEAAAEPEVIKQKPPEETEEKPEGSPGKKE